MRCRRKRPLPRQQFLTATAGSAWIRIVPTEVLLELFVAVHDARAALDMRLGGKPLRSRPLCPLSYGGNWRRAWDSNPGGLIALAVFGTAAINRTPPALRVGACAGVIGRSRTDTPRATTERSAVELRPHRLQAAAEEMAPAEGFEPPSPRFGDACSAEVELRRYGRGKRIRTFDLAGPGRAP